MMNSSVKAVCKHCGKQADANSFILDFEYKMMLCPQCVKSSKIFRQSNTDERRANNMDNFWDSEKTGLRERSEQTSRESRTSGGRFSLEERKSPKTEKKEEEEAKSVKLPKAPGWDAEDEYLEKMHSAKTKQKVAVEKIDEEYVKYQCPHCKYTFKYSVVRQKPGSCPYCSSSIERMQF